jgi:hypothetical protein
MDQPTKSFLNLENRYFTNKIIPTLIKENDNEEVTVQQEILLEIEKYYRSLYQNRNEQCDFDLNEMLLNTNYPKLNGTQKHHWKMKSPMKKQHWL